eukprot:4218472-Amphidinium_carterae.1
MEDQQNELRATRQGLEQEFQSGMERHQAAMDAEDDRIVRMMQRGRGRYREPRRADALHPHLDSSPENPNDYWGDSFDSSPDPFNLDAYEQGSSNDSEGTYATPQHTNETPTLEEDLTWEQEDLEEE